MKARDVRDVRAREASAARQLARMRRTHAGHVLRTLVDAWRGERPLVAHHRRARRTMLRRVLRALDAATGRAVRSKAGRPLLPLGCWTSPMVAQALGIVARYWPAAVESRCAAACVVVRVAVLPCGARNFHGGAGRPPLRRCSGESPAMS
ncbi:hypothetical protein F511_41086 [Dorcoceras hygrometricum]|uniref:Uncharacterized protein n=1 Tax=Dorcoceras hygrometricum TaxID=472368 RepID=A0A2Z7BZV2_9LAMI|nr:hypothetical protein F511_41086 [Dorcoceras hygrometricum]